MVPKIIKSHPKSISEHGPFQTLVFETILSSKKLKIRWCGTSKTWFSHGEYCKNQDFHHSGNSAKIIEMRLETMPKLTPNVTKIYAKTHQKATPKTTLKKLHIGSKNCPKMMPAFVLNAAKINPRASRGAPWSPKTI